MAIENISLFICEQVARVPDRSPRFDRSTVWICCPFHGEGMERTPSLKVNLEGSKYQVGTAYCYACRKPYSWNEIAERLNLKTIKVSNVVHDTGQFSFRDYKVDLPDLKKMLPWPQQDWRGIDYNTIAEFDGRLEFLRREVHIYFPVFIRREYVGGVHAVIEITEQEKERGRKAYLNVTGEWSAKSVFGYNQARTRKGPLWVVEGPRDTLKVHQLGGRVVGMLGAAVTAEKIKLIETLDPPIIYSAFDPDAAGAKATLQLKKQISYIPIRPIVFPKGKDPAKLTQVGYDRLVRKLAAEGRR